MPKFVEFNDGEKDRLAIVLGPADDEGKDRLFVFEGSVHTAAKRAKADYGPEGGGGTYHERD